MEKIGMKQNELTINAYYNHTTDTAFVSMFYNRNDGVTVFRGTDESRESNEMAKMVFEVCSSEYAAETLMNEIYKEVSEAGNLDASHLNNLLNYSQNILERFRTEREIDDMLREA